MPAAATSEATIALRRANAFARRGVTIAFGPIQRRVPCRSPEGVDLARQRVASKVILKP